MQQENKVTIEEMNRVIALFDGKKYFATDGHDGGKSFFSDDPFDDYDECLKFCKKTNRSHKRTGFGKTNYKPQFHPIILKYDSSWDWLMPVVEKIEAIGYDFHMGAVRMFNLGMESWVRFCRIETWNTEIVAEHSNSNPKIQQVFETVYEFIIWYNKTQNQ